MRLKTVSPHQRLGTPGTKSETEGSSGAYSLPRKQKSVSMVIKKCLAQGLQHSSCISFGDVMVPNIE